MFNDHEIEGCLGSQACKVEGVNLELLATASDHDQILLEKVQTCPTHWTE